MIPYFQEFVKALSNYQNLPVLCCWSVTVIAGALVALGLSGLRK